MDVFNDKAMNALTIRTISISRKILPGVLQIRQKVFLSEVTTYTVYMQVHITLQLCNEHYRSRK
jgi:hypothetical protein